MRMSPEDVTDSKEFADYARQELGTPKPTGTGWGHLNKELKAFWGKHPDATWGTLTRGVGMFKERNFRPDSTGVLVYVVSMLCDSGEVSMATQIDIDKEVLAAVQKETDRSWQLKLLGATGEYRDLVMDEWRAEREPAL